MQKNLADVTIFNKSKMFEMCTLLGKGYMYIVIIMKKNI